MAYSTNLANASSYYTANSNIAPSIPTSVVARVQDIVLDETHPDWELYGKDQAINGIRFKVLNSSQEEGEFPFAFCGVTSINKVPLINELVEIIYEISDSSEETSYKPKAYYTRVLNVWNNAAHNASPDINTSTEDIDLGKDVVEVETVKSLNPFPGDTIIEGRLGQSLRFSGYYHPKSILPLPDKSNNAEPYAILRVGQDIQDDSLLRYTEDINKDHSSIYLTSNHIIPLEASSTKQDTYRTDAPASLNTYQGKQVVINSDRVVLHSANNHLLLNSKNSIGFSGNSLNLDGTEYTSIDSPAIYLGSKAEEPVLKGDTAVKLLEDILNALTGLVNTHSLSTPATAHVQLIAGAQSILPKLQSFKSKLQSLKSKKVFVE